MPQYGMIVYSPSPADPMDLSPEHLEALAAFPDQAKALKGKVLGGTYFAKQRGFAFDPSTTAMTIEGDDVRNGTLTGSSLVAAAFFVVAAPSVEVATQIAKLHPAARAGAIEVHLVFKPADLIQNDYDD
ncbi:MAG TPA: hypothetical protein VFG89_02245 [Coriobacteriia bacterium]|nr:hypothetical protein [Coriobacteriia bacterium]